MQVIQLSMIMENLHFTHFRQEYFYGHTTSIIGNGVALDVPVFFKEVQSIIDQGCSDAEDSGI